MDEVWDYLQKQNLTLDEKYELYEIFKEEAEEYSRETAWESLEQSVKDMTS